MSRRLFLRSRDASFFSGIGGKIVIANIAGLVVFFLGALAVNFSRQSLTDVRINAMIEQADMLAGALTAGAEEKRNPDFLVKGANGVFLRPPIISAEMRALLFNKEGKLVEDSESHPPGAVKVYELPLEETAFDKWKRKFDAFRMSISYRLTGESPPLFEETDGKTVQDFPEVNRALAGEKVGVIRINSRDEMIMSVAVPVRRLGPILGALHVSVSGQEIANIIAEDRRKLWNLFTVALVMSLFVSSLLARAIASPLRQLSRAARHYETRSFMRADKPAFINHIPDFSRRRDEIGSLSLSLQIMFDSLETRMKEAESFAAEMSHELKNPLTSLKSALETAQKIDDSAKKKLLYNIVHHDIRRLDRLIGDISGLSRLEGEMLRENDERVNITKLLINLILHYTETRTPQDPEIITDFPKNDIFTRGLAERLGQVFRNLIDNALSFTPADKKVTVSLRLDNGMIIVSVADEGAGIPPEVKEKIFDRFYSHRPTASKFGNHSGLGLAIVKKITEAHDGKITADNRLNESGEVIGAIFKVFLRLI